MSGIRHRERGELEAEVLRLLRSQGRPIAARELQALFSGNIPAYTTLMTALSRLEKKGEVRRWGISPRRIRFEATRSDDEQASVAMLSALEDAGDRQAALLAFAGNLDEGDIALLRNAFGRPARD